MPELGDRFASLSRTSAPDLWREIEVREPRNAIEPSSARRVLVAAVAFVVAIAGIGIAAVTFGGSAPPIRPSTGVANERIAFVRDGRDAQTDVYSMRPDGTDVRRLTRTSQSEDEPVWSPDATRIAFSIREEGDPAAYVIGLTDADGTNGGEVPGTRLQNHNPVGSPAWSPDGGEITFAAYGDGGGIYATGVAGGPAQQLTTAGPPTARVDGEPVWSPDGTSMAFIRWILGDLETQSEYQILRIGTVGRHPTILARFPSDAREGSGDLEVSGLSWSPDGSRLAFTSLGEVYVVDASGGEPERIVPCAVLGCSEDTRVRTASTSWSPDGTRIAFTAWLDVSIDANEPPMIYVATVTAMPALVASTGVHGSSPSWAPVETASESQEPAKGNGPIYFRVGGGDGGSQVESIEPDGTDRRVVFPEDSRVHYTRIVFSPDGTRIAFDNFLQGEYGIETADPDGSDIVRLTDGVNDSWASWSPDGTKILFSSTRYDPSIEQCMPGFPHEFGCRTDIYVMDADGSDVIRLTDDHAGEFMARWSPDGGRIAFVREGDPTAGIYEAVYTMRPDGTDVRRVSSASGGSDFWPSWSPDGTQLAFSAIRNEDWGIWIVNADGSDEHMTLGGTGAGYVDNPVWSPDGNLIAFVGNMTVDDYSPEDALYVMHPDGTGVTPIADAPSMGVAGDIAWQPIQAPAETDGPTTSLPPSTAEAVDTFAVDHEVRSVVYGEGSVWVAASNSDGTPSGRIIRIDPETHEVQAEIPVEVIPTWEVGGGAMVVSEGSLWVTGAIEGAGVDGISDAAVIRIDASTNGVAQTFTLGGEVGADLDVHGWPPVGAGIR
jgi:Tol biopolymer transport system component